MSLRLDIHRTNGLDKDGLIGARLRHSPWSPVWSLDGEGNLRCRWGAHPLRKYGGMSLRGMWRSPGKRTGFTPTCRRSQAGAVPNLEGSSGLQAEPQTSTHLPMVGHSVVAKQLLRTAIGRGDCAFLLPRTLGASQARCSKGRRDVGHPEGQVPRSSVEPTLQQWKLFGSCNGSVATKTLVYSGMLSHCFNLNRCFLMESFGSADSPRGSRHPSSHGPATRGREPRALSAPPVGPRAPPLPVLVRWRNPHNNTRSATEPFATKGRPGFKDGLVEKSRSAA
ncbi:hypothetical protein B0T17DRAFT_506873 [Bombardia bombarda]|uniref:Uncharacterized protein n=1 Tax=Bombardia bombarda TaxID=252184 RepID=A0AA39XAL1_9PEZI|nr:hypothetical protein B0T17DRAFT_506873 [Bombardia bombarda]